MLVLILGILSRFWKKIVLSLWSHADCANFLLGHWYVSGKATVPYTKEITCDPKVNSHLVRENLGCIV